MERGGGRVPAAQVCDRHDAARDVFAGLRGSGNFKAGRNRRLPFAGGRSGKNRPADFGAKARRRRRGKLLDYAIRLAWLAGRDGRRHFAPEWSPRRKFSP